MLQRSTSYPVSSAAAASFANRGSARARSSHCGLTSRRFLTNQVAALSKLSAAETEAANRAYVERVSSGLTFAEDVVRQRCPERLPYDKKYLREAIDPSPLVAPRRPTVQSGSGGHCGPSRPITPHAPCIPSNKWVKQRPVKLQPIAREKREAEGDAKEDGGEGSGALTQEGEEGKRPCKVAQWDTYLVSLLSQSTAEWIVKSTPGEHQQELDDFLFARYGNTLGDPDSPEPAQPTDEELAGTSSPGRREEKPRPPWRKDGDTMLDRVRKLVKSEKPPKRPYEEPTATAFYRLPIAIRRAQKALKIVEDEAVNQTAFNITVCSPNQPPHMPALRDYLNPAVGDKIFETANAFQQERLTGVQQVYDAAEPDRIVMETSSRYRKQLQPLVPRAAETWLDASVRQDDAPPTQCKRYVGPRRWAGLPQLVIPYSSNIIDPFAADDYRPEKSKFEDAEAAPLPTSKKLSYHKINESRETRSNVNGTLIAIVNDWRAKWSLDMRYADATPEDLIRDMADMQVHVRLKAITTCARAAEYRPPPAPGISLETAPTNQIALLPNNLFIALECCLEDDQEQVRRAAAIALYALERPTGKAESILRRCLRTARSVDRWTAAQCLAFYGECDSEVVGELVSQLLTTDQALRYEQAAHLLALLSDSSTLVHSMIGEQLNSSSWRQKVMACRMLPRLNGTINKDLVQKLLQLLWCDWHQAVRAAAAEALGRTAHGRDVHDSLLRQLGGSDERTRLLAIAHVGCLGIMTAKLLPVFLDCFDSSYVSVRTEVCIAAGRLHINDQLVLDKLVQLATYDDVWKVKAVAIKVLSEIGFLTPDIRACILWAFRYESTEEVRTQACQSIVDLRIIDEQTIQVLQDRYLVEQSSMVHQKIGEALSMCDISPSADIATVTQIKSEVRKLSTVGNIFQHILQNERDELRDGNLRRLVCTPHVPESGSERGTIAAAAVGTGGAPSSVAARGATGAAPFSAGGAAVAARPPVAAQSAIVTAPSLVVGAPPPVAARGAVRRSTVGASSAPLPAVSRRATLDGAPPVSRRQQRGREHSTSTLYQLNIHEIFRRTIYGDVVEPTTISPPLLAAVPSGGWSDCTPAGESPSLTPRRRNSRHADQPLYAKLGIVYSVDDIEFDATDALRHTSSEVVNMPTAAADAGDAGDGRGDGDDASSPSDTDR